MQEKADDVLYIRRKRLQLQLLRRLSQQVLNRLLHAAATAPDLHSLRLRQYC